MKKKIVKKYHPTNQYKKKRLNKTIFSALIQEEKVHNIF